MSAYIDDGEKFVARLGGEYSPGSKKAVKSLELTDRRIYFSSPGVKGTAESVTSSVIDASDISAVTYSVEKPRGSFGLGIFLLVLAAIAGIVWGAVSFVGKENAEIMALLLPIIIGVCVGIAALVLCYVITLLIKRSRRAVTVSIEYAGLILRTNFYGVKDDKLEEFRRWTMRVKDKLVGRSAPPLPESATTIEPTVEQNIRQDNTVSEEQQKKTDSAKKSEKKKTLDASSL